MRSRMLAIVGLAVLAGAANATITIDFSNVYTGDTPGGTAPWATLTIENDSVNTGQVNFTLSHNASSSAGQFLTELNLNMSSIPDDLATVGTLSSKISGVDWGDNFTTDAGTMFDFKINFETSNAGGGANRLKPGESVSWSLSGTGLDENFFNTLSEPNGGADPTLALLHLQGIAGGGSSKLSPVPEPASMSILALGLVGLARRRRKNS